MDQETKQMFGVVIDKLNNVGTRLDVIDEKFDAVGARLDSMDEKFNAMDDRLSTMDSRQNEIFSVVKAIEHANSVNRAEIDSLTYKVGNVEGTFLAVGEIIEKNIPSG